MQNYRHLSFDERKLIEQALIRGDSFKHISRILNRSCSTISREVTRNVSVKRVGSYGSPFNDCKYRTLCMEYRLCDKEGCKKASCKGCPFCFRLCPRYEKETCGLLFSPPYVCNGCEKRSKCTLEKFIYRAREAQKTYLDTLAGSRDGISVTQPELERLDKIISPLILKGHSPHVICRNNKDEIMLDEKTLYKYIDAGLFSVKNLDLQRKVKFKPRKRKALLKIEPACRHGRTYRDFLAFMEQRPDTAIVQMDSVEGKKGDGESVLLTIHFVMSQFMLAFIREANTARSVNENIDRLFSLLGPDVFINLFPLCLLDNGSEFSAPSAIEFDSEQRRRTTVFYCDPSAPYQKGAIEHNHTLLRRVIPKGRSLNGYTQKDIDLLMSHVNSYPRKKLNDLSPFEAFSFFHNAAIIEKFGIWRISPNEVNLTPGLLLRR